MVETHHGPASSSSLVDLYNYKLIIVSSLVCRPSLRTFTSRILSKIRNRNSARKR